MRKQEAVSDGETFGQRRAMGDRATAAARSQTPAVPQSGTQAAGRPESPRIKYGAGSGGGRSPVRGQRGRPRRRPQGLYADRAYDSRRHRQELRRRHIAPALARRGAEHGSGLGVYRWAVERTLGWLYQFRRLRVRYERRADIHEAFLSLGCSIICFRRLISFC